MQVLPVCEQEHRVLCTNNAEIMSKENTQNMWWGNQDNEDCH